jgi:hypothetical protein
MGHALRGTRTLQRTESSRKTLVYNFLVLGKGPKYLY